MLLQLACLQCLICLLCLVLFNYHDVYIEVTNYIALKLPDALNSVIYQCCLVMVELSW